MRKALKVYGCTLMAYNSTTVPPIAQVITEPNTKSYLASEMQASACCSDD